MIRKMQNPDINRVADIWLKTNLKAHDFIPEQYWTSNYELVKSNIQEQMQCSSRFIVSEILWILPIWYCFFALKKQALSQVKTSVLTVA